MFIGTFFRAGIALPFFHFALALLFMVEPGSALRAQVTFNRHIAPILFENCSPCHRESGSAPFAFTEYEEIRPYAAMIAEVAATGYMPPWSASHIGLPLLGERRLTQSEIDLIQKWVESGIPEGEGKPAKYSAPNKAKRAIPELTIGLKAPYYLATDGNDQFKLFLFQPELDEDVYVQAIEFEAGNKQKVHHAWYFESTADDWKYIDNLLPGYAFDYYLNDQYLPLPKALTKRKPHFESDKYHLFKQIKDGGSGYAPGYSLKQYPQGTGKLMRKGTVFMVQIHYSGNGEIDAKDQSKVHFYFADNQVERSVEHLLIEEAHIDQQFYIPEDTIVSFTARQRIDSDISLINIAPHMHYRGKEISCFSISPKNDTTLLISIPDWDFNWQGIYHFKQLTKIERGSTIVLKGVYDNRADNPQNPVLPTESIEWGLNSTDEMFGVFIEYVRYRNGDEKLPLTPD